MLSRIKRWHPANWMNGQGALFSGRCMLTDMGTLDREVEAKSQTAHTSAHDVEHHALSIMR